MSATPLAVPVPTPGPEAAHAGLLEDALRTEGRLLQSLASVLERQRAAVAVDDLTVVDDSVFAAQRMLLTLGEARRRRQTVLEILTGRRDVALAELDDTLGATFTVGARVARDELRERAQRLADELEKNRRILQGALNAGDKLIRALCGAPSGPGVYGAPTGPAARSGATLLIDTQA